MMWLTTSRERATGSTLAHELTHVVLATRFPGQLPAWVDEGIASRQDDAKRKAARREILAWYISTGNWPSLTEVFAAEKIAGSDRSRYTVSASLVDFLLTRGDAAKLLAFATEGKQHGWDAAVRSHFGYTNVRTLEIAWQRWASN